MGESTPIAGEGKTINVAAAVARPCESVLEKNQPAVEEPRRKQRGIEENALRAKL